MGSGKTTFGKIIAKKSNYNFIDMDEWIEHHEKKSVSLIFAEQGQDYFRKLEKQYLNELLHCENTIIATGGGVPCFYDNMELMNKHGVTVYLKFTPEQLKMRLEACDPNTRPLLKQRQGDELLQYISETLAERESFYSKAQFILSGQDENMLEELTRLINQS